MPGERTLYRKIQVVLDYTKDGRHNDKDTLMKYIIGRQPTNFIYYYRDKTTKDIVHDYSERSIEHTIEICRELKLISGDELVLTRVGVSASDPSRFSAIIGKRASELLESKGIPVSTISRAIKSILLSNSPAPPTAEAIWNQLDRPEKVTTFQTFAQLLNLLGESRHLLMTQKRIYLPMP